MNLEFIGIRNIFCEMLVKQMDAWVDWFLIQGNK
jgi:hypothetical protein